MWTRAWLVDLERVALAGSSATGKRRSKPARQVSFPCDPGARGHRFILVSQGALAFQRLKKFVRIADAPVGGRAGIWHSAWRGNRPEEGNRISCGSPGCCRRHREPLAWEIVERNSQVATSIEVCSPLETAIWMRTIHLMKRAIRLICRSYFLSSEA